MNKRTIFVTTIACIVFSTGRVQATPVLPHWYDTQSVSVSNRGAFTNLNYGDLTSNWDATNAPDSFIDKEVWVNTDANGQQWVEAGDTDGSTGTGANQRGSFCASQFLNG